MEFESVLTIYKMLNIRQFSIFKHRPQSCSCAPACLAAWFTFVAVLMTWSDSTYAANPVIVPYSMTTQNTQLTRDELREIFFGRQTRWRDGSPLRAFVLPDQHPMHIRFSKEVLGVYPYQLRSAWDRMIYSGTGTPPSVVESLEQMKTLIKETPGAIGYIEK
jgi:hypothetical protein